ncbi:MAG TPA: hypothetical protein G4N94_03140 [Caldilineae bacterium]|nr:hypothetical protein [Caldilineae bacterium]
MIEYAPNTFALSDDEQEMVDLLKEEMNLANREEVMHLLVKQAIQRVAITCPNCGHYAKRTEENKAECRSCLSVITLSEDIWDANLPVSG